MPILICYRHMTPMPSRIRALGEIALRVEDLDEMQRFYTDVIGLPREQ